MKKNKLLLLLPAMLSLCSCSVEEIMDKIKGNDTSISDGDEKKDGEQGKHVCDFETAWSTSDTHHWHACKDETCNEKSNYGEHDYDGVEWITVTNPTETTKGLKKRACAVCGYEQTEEIPMIQHTHQGVGEWQKSDTKHWKVCSCGEVTDEADHDYEGVEWITVTPATTEAPGLQKRACTVCGYEQTDVIPQIGHTHTYSEDWTKDETGHWHAATCGHDLKSDFADHTFGDWSEKTAPTAEADGKEERICSVCGYAEERAIPRKKLDVAYPFANYKDYTMTDTVYGIKMDAAATCGDGYDGLYLSMNNIKVEMATAYTFKIKNNGSAKLELRLAYRNSTSKEYSISTNVEDYSVTSLNNKADTKVKEYKSNFIRFGIAAGDTADIKVAMINQDYDQFIFMPVHSAEVGAVSLTVIQTGTIVGNHNWKTEWSKDGDYHWHECEDENCVFISDKAKHTWVADTSKTDVPATTEQTGIAYKVCSVCGATTEVETPKVGESERDVDALALGFTNTSYYVATKDTEKTSITYTQPAGKYEKIKLANVNSLSFTKATYILIDVKNTSAADIKFCLIAKDSNGLCLTATGSALVSSELGTSYFDRVGSSNAYCVLKAGDRAVFKLCLKNDPTAFTELSVFGDPNPSADVNGSFDIYSLLVHDVLTSSEPAQTTKTVSVPTAFATDTNYTFTSASNGQNVQATANSAGGYEGVAYDVNPVVQNVQKVILTVKNPDTTNRVEVRVKLKNSSGTVINTVNKDELSITGTHSNTKLRDLSSEYVVFNVAADDTGVVTIPTTGTELGKIQMSFIHKEISINLDFSFQAVVLDK